MLRETIDGLVRVELRRARLLPGVWVYRRRTWTLSGEHWITDYGIDVFGLALWIHIPKRIDPDGQKEAK